MAEIGSADTSSYPKAALPVAPLDMVQKLGNVQQQKLGIDQAKLDQANQALGYMVRAMGSLGPNAPKEAYAKAAQNAVDQGLVPQQQENTFLAQLQSAPDSPSFYKQFMSSAMDTQKQIEFHIGRNKDINDTSNIYSGVEKPVVQGGGFNPATRMPVQLPPTAPQPNPDVNSPNYMQPGYVGPSGPSGVVPVPQPRPLSALTTGPTGPTVQTGYDFNQRFAGEPRIASGPPPMFEEGKRALTEDQANAAQKMTAIKPALLGINLLQGLKTGPGTEAWNKGVAFLKAQGLIDTAKENDPTAIYQEANKYFSQYLKGRGGRSDADLAAAEKSSPNVGIQLNPALQRLAKSAVAQDMIEAARPNAFTQSGRADYQNYGQHRATFPQSVDQRAFEAAISSPEERQKLVDKMHAKYKANPKDPEALKFFKSLDIAKKAGMFDIGQQ